MTETDFTAINFSASILKHSEPDSMHDEDARNFKLVGHDQTAAWGGGSLVEVRNGYAYVGAVGGASYSGTEGFTVHDVRDPSKPTKVFEFVAPPGVHMHKLRIVGDDTLYVNAERIPNEAGAAAKGGFFIFDISRPAEPRKVGFYELPGSGPHRFGVDNDRRLAFFPNDAEGWSRRVIWTLDTSEPTKPELVSVWGLPWQKAHQDGAKDDPRPAETTCTAHGPPMIRGNRMYCGFWGGGVAVIDCTSLTDMSLVGHVCWSPPFVGSTHTVWPIGERPYLVVTDEARARQKFWDSQFMWIVDIREETNPVPVATWFPDRDTYFNRPGRFGAHNLLEYIPDAGPWANTVFITYFNAGLRAVDVSDVLRPREIGHFVPALPDRQEAIQSNDIGMDENGLLYVIDRWGAGMHIVEYTG